MQQTMNRLYRDGVPFALATVIDVSGSTYRRQGAKMIVTRDGETIGSISGGCLENDVTDMGRQSLEQKQAMRKVYDMTADDDEVWGLGLGCNGTVEVLVEPVLPADSRPETAADV